MTDPTAFEVVWTVLTAIGIHRLWLYEDVMAPLRRLVPLKALTCPPCFSFWAALLAIGLWSLTPNVVAFTVWWLLGIYPVVRGAMSFYKAPTSEGVKKVLDLILTPSVRTKDFEPTQELPPTTKALQSSPCTTCGNKGGPLAVIMTTFNDFAAAYSLTTCVLDQARALSRLGYKVQVWVNEGCNLSEYPRNLPEAVSVRACMPLVPCAEDVVNEGGVVTILKFLEPELAALRPAVIISHDLLFQTWFVTWAAALHHLVDTPSTAWFHQAHSAPSLPRTIPAGAYHRMTVPDGHRILCVNYVDRLRFAEYYNIDQSRVVSIPNARDLRSWARMTDGAAAAVDKMKLDEADLVQVYGVSGTRMDSKGLMTVIDVFAALKAESDLRVKLVIVNAHSVPGTDESAVKVKQTIAGFSERATKAGLVMGEDMYFTSLEFPEWANGVPGPVMSDLQQYGNVFVFPTIGEAGSLVLMEAALSGALLVLNQDVSALADAVPHDQALWYSFGNGQGAPRKAVPVEVALAIEAAYRTNKVLRARRTVIKYQSIGTYARRLKTALES